MKTIESPSGMVIVVSKIVAIGIIENVAGAYNFKVYVESSEVAFIFRYVNQNNAIAKRNEIIETINNN